MEQRRIATTRRPRIPARRPSTPLTTGRQKPPLVMIADDAEDAREMYEQYLTLQGYRVVTAADGADAGLRAKACRPDIILMDLRMPRLDGWEAIRQLKKDRRTASIPVVAVSAHAQESARAEARAAGADACLTKPCLPPQVLMMVRALLSWRDSGAAPASDPLPVQLPLATIPHRKTEI